MQAKVRHRLSYSAASEGPARRPAAAEDAVRAEARAEIQAPDRVHAGRLLDHGTANYRHDRHADLSYFVKIDTPDGERTLWGKDLERAIGQSLSRAKPGDEVVVRQLGAKPVTVIRAVRDEEGRIVERTQVQTHLNRWSVEREDFLKERAHLAQLVRDPSIDAKAGTAKRPELAGTYTELHAAKLIAQELFAHPADRERFITRVREAIADEIERGEPLSAPRIRTKDPKQYPPRTPDRAQERVFELIWHPLPIIRRSPLPRVRDNDWIVGELLAHGKANYRFEEVGSPSYFVRLRTQETEEGARRRTEEADRRSLRIDGRDERRPASPDDGGLRVLWGADLEARHRRIEIPCQGRPDRRRSSGQARAAVS